MGNRWAEHMQAHRLPPVYVTRGSQIFKPLTSLWAQFTWNYSFKFSFTLVFDHFFLYMDKHWRTRKLVCREMSKKNRFLFYGVSIRMNQYPQSFGESVHQKPFASDIGVSEHCRLCWGGAFLDNRRLAEEFLEALIPIFNKRYGENNFKLYISEITSSHSKESKVKRESDIVRWRLENADFNPKSKLGFLWSWGAGASPVLH